MSNSNNIIGSEVKSWWPFVFEGNTYDLSHLKYNSFLAVDSRNPKNVVTYRLHVTYSFHCFAKDDGNLSEDEKEKLMYHAPRESRPFNFKRYQLSKYLPDIIESLSNPKTVVFHRGYENYATINVIDENGQGIDYLVSFSIFKENKKLRLHIRTAFPEDREKGKIKKVKFFTLAHNALTGKKMPSAPP